MIVISEFRIGVSKTINIGNFNSIRVEASLTVTVPETEDLAVIKRRAQEELRALLEDTYKAQRKGEEA
jgi:hypothetical protein